MLNYQRVNIPIKYPSTNLFSRRDLLPGWLDGLASCEGDRIGFYQESLIYVIMVNNSG